MGLTETLALIEIFAEKAAIQRHKERVMAEVVPFHEEQERREKQNDHHKREKREAEEREHFEQLVLATPAQIEAFSDRLDAYDAATVQALMDNGRALDEVRHQREMMEASAYQLSDGQPVFKSEDGVHVFDRRGDALSRETVDPNVIPDAAPHWESFKIAADTEHKLLVDRQHLHEFQQRLDDDRETLSKGNVTADALSRMDEALRRDQPEAVKALMPGTRAEQGGPSPRSGVSAEVFKASPFIGYISAGR